MKETKRGPKRSILGDIGEHIVAYELQKRGWDVMMNLGIGFDIYAKKGEVARRIEVKTIDPQERVGKHKRHLRQRVTDVERESCSFVILYLHGDNKFFVIPIKEIPHHNLIIMYRSKDKGITQYAEFESRWELLE